MRLNVLKSVVIAAAVCAALPIVGAQNQSKTSTGQGCGAHGFIWTSNYKPGLSQRHQLTARLLNLNGDKTMNDSEQKLVTVRGHATAAIDGQDAKLTACKIVYDHNTRILDASGDVRILRHKTVTTGHRCKFKIDSPDYLVTSESVKVIDPFEWTADGPK